MAFIRQVGNADRSDRNETPQGVDGLRRGVGQKRRRQDVGKKVELNNKTLKTIS